MKRKVSPFLTAAPETIKVLPTPLYMATSAACLTNEWVEWLGHTVPSSYAPLDLELAALREGVAIQDVSPMGCYVVSGKAVDAFMDHTFVNALGELTPGLTRLSPLCHTNGKTINIAEVAKLTDHHWWIAMPGRHGHWLKADEKSFGVEVRDLTEAYAGIRLIGPWAERVLEKTGLGAVASLPPGHAIHIALDDFTIIATHAEEEASLGFTLWCSSEKGEAFWNQLMEKGADLAIQPVGQRAAEIHRIKCGLPAAGKEFVPAHDAQKLDRRQSPLALGFQNTVAFDKPVFNGRAALLREAQADRTLRLVQMTFENGAPPSGTHLFLHNKWVPERFRRPVGLVTSSATLPDRTAGLALGLLHPDCISPDVKLEAAFSARDELVSGSAVKEGRFLRICQFGAL